MDEEKRKENWMSVWLDTSLASEGICLFVDLSEAHQCLWDPESHIYLNYPVKND